MVTLFLTERFSKMDFTETPHAEDFAMELGELIEAYRERGLDAGWMHDILLSTAEDLEEEDD